MGRFREVPLPVPRELLEGVEDAYPTVDLRLGHAKLLREQGEFPV